MVSYLLGDSYDHTGFICDCDLASYNAERLAESLDEIMDCIDKRADDITLMDISNDEPKTQFESILKTYFKDLTLEKFLTTRFQEDWFVEFEDECYFNIDFINRALVSRVCDRLGHLAVYYST